jgi:hypothetical protein
MRRGQASTEFVVLAGLMLVFFIIMVIGVQNQMVMSREQISSERVHQLFSLVNAEVMIARQVHPTYEREFFLPPTIDGQPYLLRREDENYVLIVEHRLMNYTFFLDDNQSIITPLAPGLNTIRKV